jgi:FkbM family methyltransferase
VLKRLRWYARAISNMGLPALLRMQLEKRRGLGQRFTVLTSRYCSYPLIARTGTSDLDVFFQIFGEREHRCLDAIKDAKLIIDLGANVGYASAYFLSRYPESRVVAVEPSLENFHVLTQNLAPYGDRVHAINAAVWWRDEVLRPRDQVFVGREWGFSVEPGTNAGPPIRAVTMPELLAIYPGQRVSILKIDIEGAELDLFSHDTQWLDQIDNLTIELHSNDCRTAFNRGLGNRKFNAFTSGELMCCLLIQ